MLHAIYLMKFSLYLQAEMSGMSKCRHDEMVLCRHPIIPPSRKNDYKMPSCASFLKTRIVAT